MATKPKAFNFERALNDLEKLVERMEAGELSLEDSLKTFEHGIELGRRCQQALEDAEQRVQLLTQKDGELQAEPFEPSSDED